MKSLVTALWLLVSPPAQASECFKDCVTSAEGVELIQFFEGFNPFIYKDVGGLNTIGYGHLIVPGEKFVEPLLGDAATDLLRADLKRTERGLRNQLKIPIYQHRFDALVSFAFNVGVTACLTSSPWRYALAGRHSEVPDRLGLWINVQGKPVRGLIVRRAAEGKRYSHQ